MTNQISIYPRATEKAYGLSKGNVYVFDAPVSANSQQIVHAIENQFNVSVISINTLVQKGKSIRTSVSKRKRPVLAVRSNTKKAYVTLAEGDSIKIFDEATDTDKSKKADKKESK